MRLRYRKTPVQILKKFRVVIYLLPVISFASATPPELTESPIGIGGIGFLTRLYHESTTGNHSKRTELQRRLLLIDSLGPRWVRVDAGLGTLLPNLAIDRQTGDTVQIWCSTPLNFNKLTPIFRFSLLESTLVNLWRQNIRPVLILDYGTNWMSSDTCTRDMGGKSKKRCHYQFLPEVRAWEWFLSNLKDSLDRLTAHYADLRVSKPVYLEVWNEPNMFLYNSSLYQCTESSRVEEGVKCNDRGVFTFKKPLDIRKRPCYVSKIYQLYVDSLLIPALKIFGNDPKYRVIATGPGVDPVWKYTQPSWFSAYKVIARELQNYIEINGSSLIPGGIAIHWYHHQGKDSEDSGIRKHFLSTIMATRDTLRRYAPSLRLDTLVVWITEFGRYAYSSSEQTHNGKMLRVSLDRHFNTMASMYEILFDKELRGRFRLGPGFLFNLIDLSGADRFNKPIGHFGLASSRYLSSTKLETWDEYLKPTGFFYKYLSEAFNHERSIPNIEKNGIAPALWTPLIQFKGGIFVSFIGYTIGYSEPSLEITRIPQIFVLEMSKNAEIKNIVRLTSFKYPHEELTVPTLRVIGNKMYIAYAIADSLFIWKLDKMWIRYGDIYTGILPKSPFFWAEKGFRGFISGKNKDGYVIEMIEESKRGKWETHILFQLENSDFVPIFAGRGIWLEDTARHKIMVFTDKNEFQTIPLDSTGSGLTHIGISLLKNNGTLLISRNNVLTIAELEYNGREHKWSIDKTDAMSLPYPRYQSFVYHVTSTGDLNRGIREWVATVDTYAVDRIPAEELYRRKSRTRILLFSHDGEKISTRPLYSSSLFLRLPFAVRFKSHLIVGFLEGAYDHYILRLMPLRL